MYYTLDTIYHTLYVMSYNEDTLYTTYCILYVVTCMSNTRLDIAYPMLYSKHVILCRSLDDEICPSTMLPFQGDTYRPEVELEYNINLKGWNYHVHSEFPGEFESRNLSRDLS